MKLALDDPLRHDMSHPIQSHAFNHIVPAANQYKYHARVHPGSYIDICSLRISIRFTVALNNSNDHPDPTTARAQEDAV